MKTKTKFLILSGFLSSTLLTFWLFSTYQREEKCLLRGCDFNNYESNKLVSVKTAQNLTHVTVSLESQIGEFRKRQNKNKITIKYFCKEHWDSLPYFQDGFKSIILDKENKLTYCPIYKVASTSWGLSLLQLRGKLKSHNYLSSVRKLMDETFEKPNHREAPKLTNSTIKFLIVRHPFQRLISAYRDKFQKGNKYYFYKILGEKMVKMFRPQLGIPQNKVKQKLKAVNDFLAGRSELPLAGNPFASPLGPTFKEFIQYVVSSEADDDHWRPYYIQCSLCHMEYDYILRFENISTDSKLFIEDIGKSNLITRWDNPTLNGSTTENISCEFMKELDANLMKNLVIKYNFDFQMFEYSPEMYIHCVNSSKEKS